MKRLTQEQVQSSPGDITDKVKSAKVFGPCFPNLQNEKFKADYCFQNCRDKRWVAQGEIFLTSYVKINT